jgi:pyruvate dehydrogenase E2 component (dihydrolipoamide acetyltransferase)
LFKIMLARQGQTMEQGTLVGWLKREGDEFAIGDDLYEVESEKAVIVIQATRAGRLVRTLAKPNDAVPVGAVLAIAAEPAEVPGPDAIEDYAREIHAGRQETAAQGRPEGLREEVPASSPASIRAMPKSRAIARELGVDLSTVRATGADGIISPDDVRRAAREGQRAPVPADETSMPQPSTDANVLRRVPLTPIGRSIVASLERSTRIPQFAQGVLIDATRLVSRRRAGELTFMDLFLDAVIIASREVPEVLARPVDGAVEYFSRIDLGIAAATDHGLLLPVLRDAGASTLEDRAPRWRSLIERARAGRLSIEESSGGVVAVSNLGSRGVDDGTSLLPAGYSAIVFFGSLARRPMVVGDDVVPRESIHVAVTYDHRVVDGVLGARFTTALREALEDPADPG